MAKVRLTERRVRDARHDPGKTSFLWDVQLPAFGVRVTKRGAKAYVLWTRSGSKKRLLTLGRVSELTLDAARALASSELDAIARGGADLTARRAEQKAAMTVHDGLAWFLNVHVPRRQGLGKMTPRTATDYRQQISRYVGPCLGHLKIESVERKHVERMLDKIGPGKPVQYSRVRSLTRSLFNRFAVEGWRVKADNPASDIAVPTERPRDRILNADEQAAFLAAIARQGEDAATLAILMLYETGARLSEIRLLKWEHFDADAKLLRLPASKTGPKTITLTDEALGVLARCQKVHANDFVFAGRGGNLPIGPRSIRRAFHEAAKMASLENLRPHDLRRTAIVDALVADVPITLVARLVGHSTISTTARYARHSDGQVHAAGEQMAAARRSKRGADVVAPKFGAGRRA